MQTRLRRALRRPDPALAIQPGLEDTYRHLFTRELARLGLEDDFYPVGGAANYGLLHLILRIGAELNPRSVLDVGCGQTTRLWDRLRRIGLVDEVTTVENDREWAAHVGAEVEHEIRVSDLRAERVNGAVVRTYDWAAARQHAPFDAVVVDGPRGEPHRSRAGVLLVLDAKLPSDFVIVMDDAERRGEQDTVELIHRRLRALGRVYEVGVVRAAKTQVVFAGGAYRRAAFF